uniref:NADH dehydrogenase [ubiquinone] 1 beta subcomplex subunit 3 n=1 Tax=Timema cristinae TaxID=61476 RepID=A0A7R9DK69_TIMCR|nr:unnamed protein product [Timema cristinae]
MGGNGHGHDHHKPTYKVPDWRIYKVESAPELMQVKNLLAQKGLSDPWLRNEVWRYDRTKYMKPGRSAYLFFFRGFKLGLGLTVLTIIGEKLWESSHPSIHGHDH